MFTPHTVGQHPFVKYTCPTTGIVRYWKYRFVQIHS